MGAVEDHTLENSKRTALFIKYMGSSSHCKFSLNLSQEWLTQRSIISNECVEDPIYVDKMKGLHILYVINGLKPINFKIKPRVI